MPHGTPRNPALTKLALALHGLRTARGEAGQWMELQLDAEISARAQVVPASSLGLVETSDGTVLRELEGESAVRLAPQWTYARRQTARGTSLGEIAQVYGAYAVVRLGGGCGLSLTGQACALCRGRELTEHPGEIWPVDEVIGALRAIFEEGAAEFVHFQLGYLPGDDGGLHVLFPYLEAVSRYFDTIIAVTMHPPADPRSIEHAYAAGIDALSFNLEAADEAAMQIHFPGRARFITRRRYLESLARAAQVFPSGAVISELALGLSARDRIAAAIDELTAMGVLPVISGGLPGATPVTIAEAAPLMARLFEQTLAYGLNMSWARDLSTALTPLEARYFVDNAPQLPALLGNLTRNRLGALATRSLAKLRRRLRVKRVRASLDSSHL